LQEVAVQGDLQIPQVMLVLVVVVLAELYWD